MTDGLMADHNLQRGRQLKGTREMMESERMRLEEEVRDTRKPR